MAATENTTPEQLTAQIRRQADEARELAREHPHAATAPAVYLLADSLDDVAELLDRHQQGLRMLTWHKADAV